MFSSIQANSISSCSGVKPTAPSTPNPPARLTAATTSRQWVKAKIGNSMPSWRARSVCIEVSPLDGAFRRWLEEVGPAGAVGPGSGVADGELLDAVEPAGAEAAGRGEALDV